MSFARSLPRRVKRSLLHRRIDPDADLSIPLASFRIVDLPEPFAPRSPMNSPSPIANERSRMKGLSFS